MSKIYSDAAAALEGVLSDNMLIASGGFGLCGIPERLLDAIQASGKMTRINHKQPIQVAILYWTVDANDDGTTRFYGDVYKRDQRLLGALNAPFKPEISAASR